MIGQTILLLLLTFLYKYSQTFRYYAKFAIFYGLYNLVSLFLIPVFLLRPKNIRNHVLTSYGIRFISPLIGVGWELRGKEHLEKERACIITANHQSSLDVLGCSQIWPIMRKCGAVSKREFLYAGTLGIAHWLSDAIFIDRASGKEAHRILNARLHRLVKEKIKILMFPEGTRRNTAEIHAFKKGAFIMAIDAQIPVLPVIFSSYSSFLNGEKKIFNNGHIIITALAPISTEGMTRADLPALMDLVHKQMTLTYKQTSEEIQSKTPQISLIR